MRVVIILLLSLILFGCDKAEEEIVIVPRNYTGYIIILYNQESGTKPKYADGKRVYEVSRNGILKTQFTGNYGWAGFPEVYYEKIASENKIPFRFDPKKLPVDSVVAYGGASGGANKDAEGKERVEFRLFYIGNKAQIDTAYERAEKLDIIKLTQ